MVNDLLTDIMKKQKFVISFKLSANEIEQLDSHKEIIISFKNRRFALKLV